MLEDLPELEDICQASDDSSFHSIVNDPTMFYTASFQHNQLYHRTTISVVAYIIYKFQPELTI